MRPAINRTIYYNYKNILEGGRSIRIILIIIIIIKIVADMW